MKETQYPEYDKSKESEVCPTCAHRACTKIPTETDLIGPNNPCIICLWNTQLTKTNNFVEDEKRKILA